MVLSFEKIHLNAATRMEVIIKADHILLKAIGSNYSVNIVGKLEIAMSLANVKRQTSNGP